MNEVQESPEFNPTPPDQLSSAERITLMNGYRARVRDPEDSGPTPDELRYSIELMRTERSVSAGRSNEKKAKAAPKPIDLDDI